MSTLFVVAWATTGVVALIYLFAGAVADAVDRRRRRRRARAVEALTAVMIGSHSDAAQIYEQAIRLAKSELLEVIQSLAHSLGGRSHDRLVRLVRASGAERRIRSYARSRFAGRRVLAAQLHYLVDHPDFDRTDLLEDRNVLVRIRATEALTAEQTAEELPTVLVALGDTSLAVRIASQQALVRAGHRVVEALRLVLEHRDRRLVAALTAAGYIPDHRLADAARRYLDDPDPQIRSLAVAVVAHLPGDAAVPHLQARIVDHDPDVRAATIEAIADLGRLELLSVVGTLLADTSWSVRLAAGRALDRFGPPGHLVLRRHLYDRDRYARDMARQVLESAATRRGGRLPPSAPEATAPYLPADLDLTPRAPELLSAGEAR